MNKRQELSTKSSCLSNSFTHANAIRSLLPCCMHEYSLSLDVPAALLCINTHCHRHCRMTIYVKSDVKSDFHAGVSVILSLPLPLPFNLGSKGILKSVTLLFESIACDLTVNRA